MAEPRKKYPSYIIVDRGHFTLRLYKDLSSQKAYAIAVGMQGLETPAGLYDIQWKQTNPSWYVPNSAWAGKLAGKVDPAGPGRSDQGALDGLQRRRRNPRHRPERVRVDRPQRVTRLRAHAHPGRHRRSTPTRRCTPRCSSPSPTLYTIGYERLLPPELVAELQAAGIERLIDVRFRPQSRRPGMSKTRLVRAARRSRDRLRAPARARARRRPALAFHAGRVAEGAAAFARTSKRPRRRASTRSPPSSTTRRRPRCCAWRPTRPSATAACSPSAGERRPDLRVVDL